MVILARVFFLSISPNNFNFFTILMILSWFTSFFNIPGVSEEEEEEEEGGGGEGGRE